MNSLRQLNQDNLPAINKEYQNRAYDDLSSEFQKVHSSAVRAFELIALMYNRLTLVENFSHKDAVTKIQNDHKHLVGFSKRNISRSLPLDNPAVPRRVRPSWRKSSLTGANTPSKLSNIIQGQDENSKLSLTYDNTDATKTDANLATKSSAQSLECSSQLITADNVAYASSASINETHNVLEFEFHLPKQDILKHMGEVYPWLDDEDLKVWFSGKIDRKSGHVISAKLGRTSQQQVDLNNGGDMQNK
jgi:hypothetical protein